MVEFGTAGIRGRVPAEIDTATAMAVGEAVVATASTATPTVVVGRDGRHTGSALTEATVAGVISAGGDAIVAGIVPTPVLAWASQDRHGIMLTASHNPPADNGIKVFADGAEIDTEREGAIEDAVYRHQVSAWDRFGSRESIDPVGAYLDDSAAYLSGERASMDDVSDATLAKLRIAVDAGGGVAGDVISELFDGIDVSVTSLNADVDGTFAARPSKPTPETLATTRAWLARHHDRTGDIDLAVALDGDGDRLVVLDSDGTVIHEDTVLAAIARHYVRHTDADRPVVITTPNASARIDAAVEEAGGVIRRTALGTLHEGIATVRTDETAGPVVFAAEPWKHIHPRHGPWIDAIVSAGIFAMLTASAGSIHALTDDIADPPYQKRSVTCPDDDKATIMAELATIVQDEFPDATHSETPDGIRLTFDTDEWLLVRPSGTEPKLRVYAEGEISTEKRIDTLIELIEAIRPSTE